MSSKLINSVVFKKKSNMKDDKYGPKKEPKSNDEEIIPTPEYLNALSQFIERRKPDDKIETSRSSKPDKSSSVNYEKFQSGKINDSLQKHVFKFTTSPEFSSDAIRVVQSEPVPRKILFNSKQDRNKINEAIKNQGNRKVKTKDEPKNSEINKFSEFSEPTGAGTQITNELKNVEVIKFLELKLSKLLEPKDFGAFCEWRFGSWNYSKVAIRRVKSHSIQNTKEFFEPEIKALTKLRHCNILLLMGFTNDTSNSTMVVYESFQFTLYTYLHEMVGSMPFNQIIQLITQIAEGILYANKIGIIHTNLSSHCIMLFNDFLPKICAFDYSVKKGHSVGKDPGRNQWYQWLAPEFFRPRALIATPAIDIYSLCVILWECSYLSVPWFNISKTHLIQIFNEWKMCLKISPEYLPTEIYEILQKGLVIDPHIRSISVKNVILLLKQVKLTEEAAIPKRLTDLPQRVYVKKCSISEPELKHSVIHSSTTPSPKSLSSNQSPQQITRLPNRLVVVETPPKSNDTSVRQIIADHESFIQSSRESLNYVNIDNTNLYIMNTVIKPASHRTGMIKLPATPLNQTTTTTTSIISSDYKEPTPAHNISVVALRNFFERTKISEIASDPIVQDLTDFNFIHNLVKDLVEVATEPKSFKSELIIELKNSDKITLTTDEFERINLEMFMIFVKLYNQFMKSYFTTEAPKLKLKTYLKSQVREMYDQSKLYPDSFFTHPTFSYWNSMLRFFLNSMLEDNYIDEDYSADSMKLSNSK